MATSTCCKQAHRAQKKSQKMKSYIEEVEAQGELLHFSKGQVLFYEGHIPFGMFVLKKGRVLFSKNSTSDSSPKTFSTEDNFLGLDHLVLGLPYCASCIADEKTEVLFFSKAFLS